MVYTLPYMEQDSVFQKIPDLYVPKVDSITRAKDIVLLIPVKLPYRRCPSDGWKPDSRSSNYAGSGGAIAQDPTICGPIYDP
jgi:hypothetical protein